MARPFAPLRTCLKPEDVEEYGYTVACPGCEPLVHLLGRRRSPAPRSAQAGLNRISADAKARWASGSYRRPAYQYAEELCLVHAVSGRGHAPIPSEQPDHPAIGTRRNLIARRRNPFAGTSPFFYAYTVS